MKTILIFLSLFAISFPAFAAKSPQKQIVTLSVTENGFEPGRVDVKPGIPVVLKVTRKTDSTCANQIVIPAKKINKELPLNKEVTVEVGKLEKGEIRFACSMDMISGHILVK